MTCSENCNKHCENHSQGRTLKFWTIECRPVKIGRPNFGPQKLEDRRSEVKTCSSMKYPGQNCSSMKYLRSSNFYGPTFGRSNLRSFHTSQYSTSKHCCCTILKFALAVVKFRINVFSLKFTGFSGSCCFHMTAF